jgi:hypothetical protein
MASTYQPIQAFDYAKRFIKNMSLEQVQVDILDQTLKYMWMAAPWRWTLGAFPSFNISANVQQYTVTCPADFLYLLYSYMAVKETASIRVLSVEPILTTFLAQYGQTSQIAVNSPVPGGSTAVNIYPNPGALDPVYSATIYSYYKRTSPVLTSLNIFTAGTQVFDDEWFWVYESGVLYYAYLFADDQRAGGAQIDPASNKVTFTGQRGVFEANILLMKEREKLLSISPPMGGPDQEVKLSK